MGGNNIMSGTEAGVLAGVVLVISPWLSFDNGDFLTKFLIMVFGLIVLISSLYLSQEKRIKDNDKHLTHIYEE